MSNVKILSLDVQWWYHAGLGYQQSTGRPEEDVLQNVGEDGLTSPQPLIDLALKWMRWGRMRHVSGCDEAWIVYHLQTPFPRWKWCQDQLNISEASTIVQCSEGCFELACAYQPRMVLSTSPVSSSSSSPSPSSSASATASSSSTCTAQRTYHGMGHWTNDEEDCKKIPFQILLQQSHQTFTGEVLASQRSWPKVAIGHVYEQEGVATHVDACQGFAQLITHGHLHQPFKIKTSTLVSLPCSECMTTSSSRVCRTCANHPSLCQACADTTHKARIFQNHDIQALPPLSSTVNTEDPTLCKHTQIIQCTHGCVQIVAPRCFGAIPWAQHSEQQDWRWQACSC